MPLPDSIGRYEIKAELGRGGMATVYRAYDPRIKRDVAIRILPRELLHNPEFRVRFEREAADSRQDGSQPAWTFYFRCAEFSGRNGSAYKIVFHFDGNVGASVRQSGSDDKWLSSINQSLLRASGSGKSTNHVLVIAKGQVIALFVSGQPIFRSDVEPRWLNGGMGWDAGGTVAFDNFKIWDISDLSSP